MKPHKTTLRMLTAISLLTFAVLGCRGLANQPDWTKARKIAGSAQGLSHISGLVIDEKFAYVTIGGTIADQNAGTIGLRKIALDSGEVTVLDDGRVNFTQSDRGGVAIDDKFIYWNAYGKILRIAKVGGQPDIIASEHVGIGADIVVDNEKVYWANHGYYSSNSPTRPSPVYCVSKQGGATQIFADQQYIPSNLVLDEKFVYWVTPESIVKKAKSGGEPQVIFQASKEEGVDELVQDSESLYFGFRGAGKSRWALRRISKQGGEAQTMAKTFTLGQNIADDSNIYFFDEHSLMKDDLCKVSKTGGPVTRLDTGYSNGIMTQSTTLIYFTAGDDLYSFLK